MDCPSVRWNQTEIRPAVQVTVSVPSLNIERVSPGSGSGDLQLILALPPNVRIDVAWGKRWGSGARERKRE